MKKITLIIVLTLASVTALSSRAQEPLLKIEQVMTPQEMQQTGVLTLSSQQRDALNRWLVNFCLCTCFSKPQRIVLSYRKDRLRRVSSRKALACGRFPDRAESGMRPWAVCDDCGERQIRPDKPGAALGSHRDGFR